MASIPRTLSSLTRLASPLSFATKRTPTTLGQRFNSSTSTSTVASRVAQVSERVAAAEKPSGLEASVPVMWALSGGAILAAYSRIDGSKEDYVEKLLIV